MEKHALILASSSYVDSYFDPLPGAIADATGLVEVLGDPTIGGFSVESVVDADQRAVMRPVESFFARASSDDLLLLHLSLHGWKDRRGQLHFVVGDTERDFLGSTAIPASFVNDCMVHSKCRRIVLMLDCCYSGAFSRAMRRSAGRLHVDLTEPFFGYGRVVMTASTALQYAHERLPDVVRTSTTPSRPSVFTAAVVEGLREGSADLDGDGWISTTELYEYAAGQVAKRMPDQTPTLSFDNVRGTIYLARSRRQSEADILVELRGAAAERQAHKRIGALKLADRLLASVDERTRRAARDILASLVVDNDRDVAQRSRRLWHARGLGDPPSATTRLRRLPPASARKVGHNSATTNSMHSSPRSARRGVVHSLATIANGDDLIRYVVHAQLSYVDVTQARAAKAIGLDPSALSKRLVGRQKFSVGELRALDELVVAVADSKQHTGNLAQFGVQVGRLRGRESISASIPSIWTHDILDAVSDEDDDLAVLIQASLLLTNLARVHQVGKPSSIIRSRYGEQIALITQRLIIIAVSPPTYRNIEAQVLLGNLAQYAFDIVVDEIEHSIESSPLGFRVWPALTELLMISQDLERRSNPFVSGALRPRLRALLGEAAHLRAGSIYPGSSLDLELAIAVPNGWLGPNFITNLLLQRAKDTEAALRERGTAAMGMWRRAYECGSTGDPYVSSMLHELVDQFLGETSQGQDVASGLQWIAATLNRAMMEDRAVCETWPDVDQPWFRAVGEAVERLDDYGIPKLILPATKGLFRHVLLQNAGVERRKAMDTLVAGGYVDPVTRAVGALLCDERAVEWVRIRALLALGFMQHRSQFVKATLLHACEWAYRRFIEQHEPSRARIDELHAVLFAIGDCYGVKGAEAEAREIRERLRSILSDLVTKRQTTDKPRYPLARAIAYLLTFTAQPRRPDGELDFSEMLLQDLREHPDPVTQNFTRWALQFRFSPGGRTKSLLPATP